MPSGLRAQNVLQELVMPGPLVQGHAKLERECSSCHEPFSRQSQSRLCLACHKEIAADRSARKGLHGRAPDASAQDCRHCHTDHKGRDADIVLLDRDLFDHALTDFALNGAHRTVACDGCHAQKAKLRDAPRRCVDCHRADEPHNGRLGTACDTCHSESAWQPPKPFDHNKTKFPLTGAHKDVACATCHIGEAYKNIGTTCVTCHRIQDVHESRYGTKCDSCHEPTRWQTVRFNHDRDTKYPLRGQHARVKCDACHTGDLYRDKLATTCISCHQKNDVHKGGLGRDCEQCHTESGWRHKITFDHDLTKFPLVGRHKRVACAQCHLSPTYKDTPSACVSCHKDDHHQGRLGPDCGLCHSANGWAQWRFDHNRQTRYPLTGAHKGLQCEACHARKHVTKIVLPTDCYSCHSRDDIHQGSFGRSCERCHTTSSFKQGGNVR
jgi:hypothetical protein